MTAIKIKFVERLTGHKSSIYALEQISETQFVAGDGLGICILWNLENTEIAHAILQVPSNIFCLKYFKEQNLLFIGTFSGEAYLVNFSKREIVWQQMLDKAGIFCAEKIGSLLYVGTGSGKIFVLNVQHQTVQIKNEHTIGKASIRKIVQVADNELLAASSDHFLYKIDLQEKVVFKLNKHHTDAVFSIAKLTANHFISGSKDATFKVWENDKVVHSVPAHLWTINDIQLSPDKKYFATASRDKSLKIWNAKNYELLKVIDQSKAEFHVNSVNKIYWSSYKNCLISASDDRSILIHQIL